MTATRLFGFRYSVYVRAVRLGLEERGIRYDLIEVDPFAPADPENPNPHPMNRVPVLAHDGFQVFETSAILTYLAGLPGGALIPTDPKAHARMVQVQSIVDSYAYWPLVRQVYSAAAYDIAQGGKRDQAEIDRGLAASLPALSMVEDIAAEGFVLKNQCLTLADLHLAPMIAAFATAPEGRACLAGFPALSHWWNAFQTRDSLRKTDPGLPPLG
ncbi:MAG: glutathione S-transferase family protein [Pseudooceanicola sp.]